MEWTPAPDDDQTLHLRLGSHVAFAYRNAVELRAPYTSMTASVGRCYNRVGCFQTMEAAQAAAVRCLLGRHDLTAHERAALLAAFPDLA